MPTRTQLVSAINSLRGRTPTTPIRDTELADMLESWVNYFDNYGEIMPETFQSQLTDILNTYDGHVATFQENIQAAASERELSELAAINSEQKRAETELLKNAAQLLVDHALLAINPLGEYNAVTNIPALATVPPAAPTVPIGSYYTVTEPGALGFSGSNFASGLAAVVGARLIKKSETQWFYVRPSDLALQKAITNEVQIGKKFDEVFNPIAIQNGYKFLAKGKGTVGSKLVQPYLYFNVNAIDWGGSAVNVTFKCKILVKGTNALSITSAILQNRNAPEYSGAVIGQNGNGGGATLTDSVVFDYSFTKSINTAKTVYMHWFLNFDPINEDAVNEIYIYEPTLSIGSAPGVFAGAGIFQPNSTDTFTSTPTIAPAAATVPYVDLGVNSAKSYTASLLLNNNAGDNFNLSLVRAADWFVANTTTFVVPETDTFLLNLGVVNTVFMPQDSNLSGARRDLFYKQKFDRVIDGKYCQVVFYMKTTDPGKFRNDVVFCGKTGGGNSNRTILSHSVTQVSPGIWEVVNTFQAPASGDYNEVWIGSSFRNGGTDNAAALGVSGFFCWIQDTLPAYKVVTTSLPVIYKDLFKQVDLLRALIPNLASYQANPLIGKKFNMLGDSLTQGHGVGANATYAKVLADRNGMDYVSHGISGTCLALESNGFGLSMSNPARYGAMRNDADYVGVWGTTNDITAAVPIGNDSDSTVATVKGALNLLCIALIEKYPTKKVFFVTPLNHKTTAKSYADAIITICEKYGIPVFDLYRKSGFYPINQTQRNALMYNATPENPATDVQHPNVAGHLMLSYKFESFLRTL